ncbi:arylsulfotransferase family protein [Candidatus Omnitrophota bacterium]
MPVLSKVIIIILVLTLITGYILGFSQAIFPFIIFLFVAKFIIIFLIFLFIYWSVSALLWRFTPVSKVFQGRKSWFWAITFVLAIVCIGVVIVIKDFYTSIDFSSSESLKSLPYLSYVDEDRHSGKKGVLSYKPDSISDGVNIFNFCRIPSAFLMDNNGNILHKWAPEMEVQKKYWEWHHVQLYDNGDLLVAVADVGLIRFDKNADIKWIAKTRAHHDIAIADNKDIYTISRRERIVFKHGLPVPVLEDYIVIISPGGKIKKEIPLVKILKKEIPFRKILNIYRWISEYKNFKEIIDARKNSDFTFIRSSEADILHTNTIEIIDRDIDGVCEKGDILLSSYMLDLVCIIDIEKNKLKWSWGKDYLENPHHPTLLDNGNILIYDNGNRREYSRVVELDPITKGVSWKYDARPRSSFFSFWAGANQRLPNGNTLITESSQGRVFEVTRSGKIVWEYNSSFIFPNGKKATIYRMMRLVDPKDYSFIKSSD